MAGEREALEAAINSGISAWRNREKTGSMAGAIADFVEGAGWRPPPEPQGCFDAEGRITAAGLARIGGMPDIDVHGSPPEPQAPRDELERGMQRVLGMPLPWSPATSPGMTDMMVQPETLDAFMEANPLPPEPQAAASEVVERANWWLSLSDDDARTHAAVEIAEEFARAVVALAARAEAAERERDGMKQERLVETHRNLADVYERTDDKLEAAEATVKRLTDAATDAIALTRKVWTEQRGLEAIRDTLTAALPGGEPVTNPAKAVPPPGEGGRAAVDAGADRRRH